MKCNYVKSSKNIVKIAWHEPHVFYTFILIGVYKSLFSAKLQKKKILNKIWKMILEGF
jgi:hypothetical protein